MNKNPFINLICIALILLFLTSACSPKIKGMTQESYRRLGFKNSVLKEGGLAVLPVIVLKYPSKKNGDSSSQIPSAPYAPQESNRGKVEKEKASNSHDAYKIILSEILLSKIQSGLSRVRLVSPGNALTILNNKKLTGDYLMFHRDFPRMGIEGSFLKSFGNALGCRYLFISQAIMSESKSEASFTFVWTFGSKSVLRSVKISGQIWDTVLGAQIWEGSGVGYNRLRPYEGEPLIEEMASEAVESLLKSIRP